MWPQGDHTVLTITTATLFYFNLLFFKLALKIIYRTFSHKNKSNFQQIVAQKFVTAKCELELNNKYKCTLTD